MDTIDTPIAFFIFNRPVETQRVFEQIKKAEPKKLFIIADGPRNEAEKDLITRTRDVVSNIDWPCEVTREYADTNLGCRKRLWSGLDFVFANTEKAIILEDDCLPDQSFFRYCAEMLDKYADNEEIMHIGGTNFQQDNPKFTINESYYFSNIAQIWGWATWKRAWNKYDGSMSSWVEKRTDGRLRKIFPNIITWHYWRYLFDRNSRNELDTWDIAWTYTCFKENGLCIMPRYNLITNIGNSDGGTHGKKSAQFMNIPAHSLDFPLIHPKEIIVNKVFDLYTYKKIFGIRPTLLKNIKCYIKDLFFP